MIAATLPTGTPAERVRTALAIIDEAKSALFVPPKDRRPLKELLAELMPKKDHSERVKKWRDFLEWHEQKFYVPNPYKEKDEIASDLTRPQAVKRAGDRMMEHHAKGVNDADKLAATFRAWHDEQAAVARRLRASKAANALHEQKKVTETKNNPCVDPLPIKQAKTTQKPESEPAKQIKTWRKR